MTVDEVPFLLLSGPPGVGKTTVAWEIFDRLVDDGSRHALVDLDLLGASWPVPSDDPHNERLRQRNLAAMWTQFRATGARRLIAAGVIENATCLAGYAAAVPGSTPIVCRLSASADALHARIRGRGRERGDGIDKLSRRAVELSGLLERDGVADLVVDTSDRDVPEVARTVLAHLGWLAGGANR